MSTEQKVKVPLTISGIKADLENGLDRVGIKEKYGLSHNDMKALFQNPKLKNLKPKKAFEPNFVLTDDEPDAPAPVAAKPKSKAAIVSGAASIPTPKEEWATETAPVAEQAPVTTAPVVEAAPVATTPASEPEAVTEKKGLW